MFANSYIFVAIMSRIGLKFNWHVFPAFHFTYSFLYKSWNRKKTASQCRKYRHRVIRIRAEHWPYYYSSYFTWDSLPRRTSLTRKAKLEIDIVRPLKLAWGTFSFFQTGLSTTCDLLHRWILNLKTSIFACIWKILSKKWEIIINNESMETDGKFKSDNSIHNITFYLHIYW